MTDIVRVIRIVQYVGPRKFVEETVKNSIHGTYEIKTQNLAITAVTLGTFPETISVPNEEVTK